MNGRHFGSLKFGATIRFEYYAPDYYLFKKKKIIMGRVEKWASERDFVT